MTFRKSRLRNPISIKGLAYIYKRSYGGNVLEFVMVSRAERLLVVFGEEEDKDALLTELGLTVKLTDRRRNYSTR